MKEGDTTQIILVSIAAYVATKYFYDWYKRSKSPLYKLPSPPTYPIIKNPQLLLAIIKGKNYLQVQKLVQTYGDIFTLDFLGESVILSDPTEVKRLFNSDTFERKNDLFTTTLMEGLLDNALFSLPTGEEWKKHRKLLQPGFGPSHLRHAGAVAELAMKDFDSVIDSKLAAQYAEINFSIAFKSITLDVISMVAFGHKFGATLQLKDNIEWNWKEMDDYVSGPMLWRLVLPKFLWNLAGIAGSSPSLVKKREKLFAFFKELKQERLTKIQSGNKQDKWDMDVLHRLLLEDNGMTEEEMYGELLGFFFAGHETTTGTLGWSLFKICDEPLLEQKLHEEVKDFDLDSPSVVENLSNLRYF
ncbi:RNA polymerase C-22 sterol desaturase [Terramyces sp. JEL0728]|nr:RNA polymerase C-22 sterol desaturase [Terramyces sp. JEL0728]